MRLFRRLVRQLQSGKYDIAALVAVAVVITLLNVLWRSLEQRPPHWDMGRHLLNSLNYYADVHGLHVYHTLTDYFYYPPLVYLVAVPFYLVFGITIPVAVLSNGVFIIMLTLATFGIGKELAGRRSGFLAAAFVLATPMMVSQFKEFQIDAPLTAMTALSLYLLIKAREFRDTKYSVWFGIVGGLGMLTKWTYVFIVALPVAYAAVVAIWRSLGRWRWLELKNLALAAVAGYAIAVPWYAANYKQIIQDLTQNSIDPTDPRLGTAASNLWYWHNLLNDQLYLLPLLLFLAGLVFLAVRYRQLKTYIYPLLLIVGVYTFFTHTQNKDPRYTLPFLSAVAVIAVHWIPSLRDRLTRRVLEGIVVVYSGAAFVAISFGLPLVPQQITFNLGPLSGVAFAQHGYIIGRPTQQNWQQQTIVKNLATLPSTQLKTVYNITPVDTIWFNYWGLFYYEARYGLSRVGSVAAAQYVIVRDVRPLCPADFRRLRQYRLLDNSQVLVCSRLPASP